MISSVYPVLMSTDVARSAEFFTDSFGFERVFEADWYVSLRRDAWELAQAILDARRDAIGGGTMLADYAARRRRDRGAGIAFTHGLVRIFGNDLPLARWSRGFALALLDVVPPAKRAFTRAMLHGMH